MKKIAALLCAMTLACVFAGAQSVTQQVRFDTYLSPSNNDLENNFSNTSWITMNTTGGVTGGALQPPDSINWGNDAIAYCRNYVNTVDTLMQTSICFKYNSALLHTSSQQRAADIWLFSGVVNHWIICSINYNQHMTIITYGAFGDSLATLTTGHWYKFVVSCKTLSLSPGDWVYAQSEVFDLGLSGTSTPVSIGRNTLTFQDLDIATSTNIDIKVSGARDGGTEVLDDFTFHGIVGSNSCALTGIAEVKGDNDGITCYPQPASEWLIMASDRTLTGNSSVRIYDNTGREILVKEDVRFPYALNISGWADGIYFAEFIFDNRVIRKKIIRQSMN